MTRNHHPPNPSEREVLQRGKQQLKKLWSDQQQEIQQMKDLRKLELSSEDVEQIMKRVKNVNMIEAESSALVAKASEMFIMDLTTRSWVDVESQNLNTLERVNVLAAIMRKAVFMSD